MNCTRFGIVLREQGWTHTRKPSITEGHWKDDLNPKPSALNRGHWKDEQGVENEIVVTILCRGLLTINDLGVLGDLQAKWVVV